MEDMLGATPHPHFTPATGRASEPSAAGPVLPSEVDTDEVNPDKVTYQPGLTTENDTESELSVLPTLPWKRTYAEVASSPHKGGAAKAKPAAAGAKASLAAKPAKLAPMKLAAVEALSDSVMESNSILPPSPQPKTTTSTKTESKTQLTTPLKTKVRKTVSITESDSPPPTAPSQPSNPKTPVLSKWV